MCSQISKFTIECVGLQTHHAGNLNSISVINNLFIYLVVQGNFPSVDSHHGCP